MVLLEKKIVPTLEKETKGGVGSVRNTAETMRPERWGEAFWYTFFLMALDYPKREAPEKRQKAAEALFQSLQGMLPCCHCRQNLTQHLKKFPLTPDVLSCRKSLLHWLVTIRNQVRRGLGQDPQDYKECVQHYVRLYKVGGLRSNRVPPKRKEDACDSESW